MSPPRDKSSSVVSLVLLEEESAVSVGRAGRAEKQAEQQHRRGNVIQTDLPDAWQLQQKCITHIVTPE